MVAARSARPRRGRRAAASRGGRRRRRRGSAPCRQRTYLPIGGSHWKCRPRTTPRCEIVWMACLKSSEYPRRVEVGLDPRLHEIPALVGEGLGREDLDAGHLLGRDLHCNLRTGDGIRSPRAESNSTAFVPPNTLPPGSTTPFTGAPNDSRHRRSGLHRLHRGATAARQGRGGPRVRQALLRRRRPRRGARQDRARAGRHPHLRPRRARRLRRRPAPRRPVERSHRRVQPEGQRGDQHARHRGGRHGVQGGRHQAVHQRVDLLDLRPRLLRARLPARRGVRGEAACRVRRLELRGGADSPRDGRRSLLSGDPAPGHGLRLEPADAIRPGGEHLHA